MQESKKNFYRKFLHEPFPVESSLHKFIHNHLCAEVACGRLLNMLDCLDYLSYTYWFRRLIVNPSYYQLASTSSEDVELYLKSFIETVIVDLEKQEVIERNIDKFGISTTSLGLISCYYYLDYRTPSFFNAKLKALTTSEKSELDFEYNLLLILCSACEFSEVPVR